MQGCDAVLVGPGLGRSTPQQPDLLSLVLAAIAQAPRLVLDADALNLLAEPAVLEAGRTALRQRVERGLEPAILSPHPGEFARLCPNGRESDSGSHCLRRGLSAADHERCGAQRRRHGDGFPAAGEQPGSMGQHFGQCRHGQAGSGDVLSGLLGSLLAQHLPLRVAVCAAVFLHGLAADLQAEALTERALTPEDIIAGLPAAFRQAGWDK